MTPVAPGFNLASLLSTTIADMGKTIADNVMNSHLLLHWLESKGMKKTRSGGAYISEPVMLGKSTAGGSYRGLEEGVAIPTDNITSAIYPWRQYRWYVTISGIENFQNSGVGEVADLLDQKIDEATLSMRDELNTDGYGDGSGNDYKAIVGLDLICAEDPDGAAVDNLGLIDAAANPVWQNYSALGSGYGVIAEFIAGLRTAYNTCSKGQDHPTIIITSQTQYEYYEHSLIQQERFMNTEIASSGFMALLLRGTPIFFDEDIAKTDSVYLLNHKHMRWNVASGCDFTPSKFYEGWERDALVSVIKLYGNLSVRNRRFNGVIYDVPSDLTDTA